IFKIKIAMYYLGSPFEPVNVTTEDVALKRSMYFKEKDVKVPFADKIIEVCKKDTGIALVIYVKASHCNKQLISYHKENYGAQMAFHVEDYVGPSTIHTTVFADLRVNGIGVYHYDKDWRLKTEHAYDKAYDLIEYRECYYLNEEATPFEEKIFYAKNWMIQKESYK